MESGVKESSWGFLILTTLLLIVIWYSISSVLDIVEISNNWPKYRCSPTVIPFASLYGYNTSENFNYCLKGIFEGQIGGVTGPFSTILGTMMKSLMTFLQNLNSMRIMIATLVGGITKVLQEFADRFKLLFSQIKLSFLKIQMLMKRLFGTFHSVIYMGLSAIQVGNNFSQTFIFKFLDTFCFAPETLIEVLNMGEIPIDSVVLGDILSNNSKVISTYRFMADGQPMVSINDIIVSTNHYVYYDGKFIEAKDHPEAKLISEWSGGSSRPLICLDTNTHKIPINGYTFSDWDETTNIDEEYMINNEIVLNGKASSMSRPWIFQPAIESSCEILCKNSILKSAINIELGDELTTGKVIGIGKRLIYSWVKLSSGKLVTPSTLIWMNNKWVRAGHIANVIKSNEPKVFYTFSVLHTGCLELLTGETIRDMCEVYSPDTENVIHKFFNCPKRKL
jgi:hypothetical protein